MFINFIYENDLVAHGENVCLKKKGRIHTWAMTSVSEKIKRTWA